MKTPLCEFDIHICAISKQAAKCDESMKAALDPGTMVRSGLRCDLLHMASMISKIGVGEGVISKL